MPPFAVLHVCLGNICRSPMAERLLALRVSERAGEDAADLVLSHSCGIGTWHVGQKMNPPAARELKSRGGSDAGFRARHIAREHVESSDLILTATDEQYEYIQETYPDALAKTFLIKHFGRIVTGMLQGGPSDASKAGRQSGRIVAGMLRGDGEVKLPFSDGSPEGVYARGVALVAAADERRADHSADPLDDPWGENRATFTRIGDEIDEALAPLVDALLS